jgi:aminobenzoyl-glutamate utilization protein B
MRTPLTGRTPPMSSIAVLSISLAMLLATSAGAQRGGRGAAPQASAPTPPGPPRVEQLKKEAAADVESMRVQTQQMVDQVFSFAELGFQEFLSIKYPTVRQ